MSTYLYRLARFAFRRRRLVLAVWLAAAIAAIAIAQASGGKTNDNFTIPGTEAQNAADILSAKFWLLPRGQPTVRAFVYKTHSIVMGSVPAIHALAEPTGSPPIGTGGERCDCRGVGALGIWTRSSTSSTSAAIGTSTN